MRSTIKCDIIHPDIIGIKGCRFMKTKIIYISGSEIFNMSDVRGAFDTVRRELGLSNDTILFGVPVDADDALCGQFDSVHAQTDTISPVQSDEVKEEVTVDIPVVQDVVDTVVEKPVKQKRTRKKVVVEETVEEPVIEPVAEVPVAEPEQNVVPILSVLGGETTVADEPECVDGAPDEDVYFKDENPDLTILNSLDLDKLPEELENDTDVMTEESNDEEISFDAADVESDIPTVEPQAATIQDSDDDDNQLEKLLQSVQSLHEEKPVEESGLKIVDAEPDETDLALEKLATEFAENQDKIVNTTKSSSRGGRIGKLKNILPFKREKHNETSLMGDLFGWAGMAANDEEFAFPEFIPTAVKK